jgi:hypothetical protein
MVKSGGEAMKAFLVFTGGGTLAVLTSYPSVTQPEFLTKLESKGITKFIAYEIPLDLARARYGAHFAVVANDLHESDDLRVLDYSGERAFKLFGFAELGPPIAYEAGHVTEARMTVAPAAASHAVRAADDLQ